MHGFVKQYHIVGVRELADTDKITIHIRDISQLTDTNHMVLFHKSGALILDSNFHIKTCIASMFALATPDIMDFLQYCQNINNINLAKSYLTHKIATHWHHN